MARSVVAWKVPADRVDHVIMGNVAQTSSDAVYLARHVGLRAGCPVETPAVTRSVSGMRMRKNIAP